MSGLKGIFKDLLNLLFGKGITIGYSSGKAFNPRDQKRSDPIRDIVEADKKRRKDNDV